MYLQIIKRFTEFCRTGDLVSVEAWMPLMLELDKIHYNPEGALWYPALEAACFGGHLNVINLLITTHEYTAVGDSMLIAAYEGGHTDLFPPSSSVRRVYDQLLHAACKSNKMYVVDFVLNYIWPHCPKDMLFWSDSLMEVASNGNYTLFMKLIEIVHVLIPDSSVERWCLSSAVAGGNLQILAYVYSKCNPIDTSHYSSMIAQACRHGRVQILSELMDMHMPNDGTIYNGIELACDYNQYKIVKLILRRAKPSHILPILSYAFEYGHEDIINEVYDPIKIQQELLSNRRMYLPIRDPTKFMEHLLANFNVPNEFIDTLFCDICTNSTLDINLVKLLLKHGAEIRFDNIIDVLAFDHIHVAKLLIESAPNTKWIFMWIKSYVLWLLEIGLRPEAFITDDETYTYAKELQATHVAVIEECDVVLARCGMPKIVSQIVALFCGGCCATTLKS